MGKQEEIVDVQGVSSETQSVNAENTMTQDEYHLATLGYKQTFFRGLGLLENWLACFATMNYTACIPLLFVFALNTGGPLAALSNWVFVGFMACNICLAMAEIAAAYPTAGGIYYWSYRLGGEWGPFLAWITVMPSCAQGATNFLLSSMQILYPDTPILTQRWFSWLLSSGALVLAIIPNMWSQSLLKGIIRTTIFTFLILFFIIWVYIPVEVSKNGKFQDPSFLTTFVNGTGQSSDAYCWIVGILFGAWQFFGWDSSVHLSEETKNASTVVARGMYTGLFVTWLASIPTLILLLLCIQDLDGIISGPYINNWMEFLMQIGGKKLAVTFGMFCWLDNLTGMSVCYISATRVTYALARDGILPFSNTFSKLSPKKKMPINAGLLVVACGVMIQLAIIGSTVAFYALTATATICAMTSYLIPVAARHTIGRKDFKPAQWNLGRWSPVCGLISCLWIPFLFVSLNLPQLFPVTSETFNYAPVMIISISAICLLGWVFPFGLGARHWFKGPRRTISDADVRNAKIVDGVGNSVLV